MKEKDLIQDRFLHVLWCMLCIALLLASGSLVYRHTVASNTTLLWNPYGFSELLINYTGGFVRRGLVGEIIHIIAHGQPAITIVNSIVFGNYVLLLMGLALLALSSSKGKPWNTAFVIAIPGGIFSMALGNLIYFRKETFFLTVLVFFGFFVSLLQKTEGVLLRQVLGCAIVIGCFFSSVVLTFVHEGFLFLSAPAFSVLLMATMRSMNEVRPSASNTICIERLVVGSYLIMSILLFCCLSHFHGSPNTAAKIWLSLHSADARVISLDGTGAGMLGRGGGINAIGESVWELLKMPVYSLVIGDFWFWLGPFSLSMIYCLTLCALSPEEGHKQPDWRLFPWLCCYGTLLIGMFFMCLVGWDWGRWIASVNLSFLVVWLSIDQQNLAFAACAEVSTSLPTHWQCRLAASASQMSHSYQNLVKRHPAIFLLLMLLFCGTCQIPEGASISTLPQNMLSFSINYTKHHILHYSQAMSQP